MNIDWSVLLTAFALYLIIEGLLPFISPSKLRKAYETVTQLSDSSIRKMGLVSIIAGLALLLLFD